MFQFYLAKMCWNPTILECQTHPIPPSVLLFAAEASPNTTRPTSNSNVGTLLLPTLDSRQTRLFTFQAVDPGAVDGATFKCFNEHEFYFFYDFGLSGRHDCLCSNKSEFRFNFLIIWISQTANPSHAQFFCRLLFCEICAPPFPLTFFCEELITK